MKFAEMLTAQASPKPVQPATSPAGEYRGFASWMNSMYGSGHSVKSAPSKSSGTSSYEGYVNKLLSKEGGGRYDLFAGERTPSHQLDKMTFGQLKALQAKRRASAAGAFQFTRDTVIEMQKRLGISDNEIFSKENQHRMAIEFTKVNEGVAKKAAGITTANDAQRYSMHFLGIGAGPKFLNALRMTPRAKFADLFPKEYASNRSMFKKRGGANATLQDVYEELRVRME